MSMKSSFTTTRKPFTLIEILVTVGILAILMGIGLGTMGLVMNKANESKTKALIKKLEIGLENYKSRVGYYLQQHEPGDFTIPKSYLNFKEFKKSFDIQDLIDNNAEEDTNNYYLLDGFGERIYYASPGIVNQTSFDIVSFGSDGKPGVENVDDNSDGTKDGGDLSTVTKRKDAVLESKAAGANCDDVTNF